MPASRLLKFNEQNLALQKQLNASAKEASAASASTSKVSKATGSGTGGRDGGRVSALGRKEGTRGTKRGRDEVRLVVSVGDVEDYFADDAIGREHTQARFEAECAGCLEGETRR